MIDLVTLPVWIGIVLMGHVGLSPQQAGGLATLFLLSVPLLGGVLAQQLGYATPGWAALVIGLLSVLCFRRCIHGRDILRASQAIA